MEKGGRKCFPVQNKSLHHWKRLPKQPFSMVVMCLPPRGQSRCPEAFLTVTPGEHMTGIQQAGHAAKYPKVPRTAPPGQAPLLQSINSTEAERPCVCSASSPGRGILETCLRLGPCSKTLPTLPLRTGKGAGDSDLGSEEPRLGRSTRRADSAHMGDTSHPEAQPCVALISCWSRFGVFSQCMANVCP